MQQYYVFCIHCGKQNMVTPGRTSHCGFCGEKLWDKDRPFRDFLVDHTKDKLKDKVSDSIYNALKNWCLSHLYGFLVTVSLVAAVTTTVSAAVNAPGKPEEVSDRPQAVENVLLKGQTQSAGNNVSQSAAAEQEALPVPEESEEVVEEEAEPETPLSFLTRPTMDYDSQIAYLASDDGRSIWEDAIFTNMYPYYFITDLDLDGLLEITIAETMGTGMFTDYATFEISPSYDSLTAVDSGDSSGYSLENFVSFGDMQDTPKTAWWDPQTGAIYYLISDVWRDGWDLNGTNYMLISMKNDQLEWTSIGYLYNERLGNEEVGTYVLDGETLDSWEDMMAALQAYGANHGWIDLNVGVHYAYGNDTSTDMETALRESSEAFYVELK